MLKQLIILASLFTGNVYAVSCVSCGTSSNTVNQTLSSGQNMVGQTFSSSDVSSGSASINVNPGGIQWWVTYPGQQPESSGTQQNSWSYFKLDDYLSMAFSVKFQECRGVVYAPFNLVGLRAKDCQQVNYPMNLVDQRSIVTFQTRMRVDKRMVGGVYQKRVLVAEEGVCQPAGCRSKQAIMTKVYLDYKIVVPQNCIINTDQIVNIDFGNVSLATFKTAGAKAEGVPPQTRTLKVECTNIAAQANLSMRVQSDTVSGKALVSNNRNVGFMLTDGNDKELTPNNVSSVIPFTLDDNASANVTIKVYPVSVTGVQPQVGVVTSLAYLRVDFA